MGFFGLLFWIVALMLLARACGRRRWGHRHERRSARRMENESSLVDALETRVHDLEARLDFTERLLQSRPSPTTSS